MKTMNLIRCGRRNSSHPTPFYCWWTYPYPVGSLVNSSLGCHFSLIPNWLIFFFIFHLIALMFDFTAWNSRESSVRSRTLTPCNFGCCLLQLVRCCSSCRALHFCCRAQHERSKRSAAKFTENDRGIQRHLHAFGGQRLVGSSCTQKTFCRVCQGLSNSVAISPPDLEVSKLIQLKLSAIFLYHFTLNEILRLIILYFDFFKGNG